MENIISHYIDEVSVQKLNNIVSNNILVTTSSLKETLIKESFHSKELIKFKVFSIQDFNNYINNRVDSKYEYLIYKKLKNFNKSKLVYNNISNILPYYCKVKNKVSERIENELINNDMSTLNDIIESEIDDFKVSEIIKFIEEFDKESNVTLFNSNLKQKIYTLDVNLKYIVEDVENIYIANDIEGSKIEVEEYNNVEDEIFSVLNKISNLLNNGVNIRDIEIYANQEYLSKVKVLSNFYNIVTNIDTYYKISEEDQNKIILAIKKNDLNNLDINKVYKKKVIQYLNDNLMYLDEEDFITFSMYKLREIKIIDKKIENTLSLKSIKYFSYDKNKYNFILGFNDKDFLQYKTDSDYFEDILKSKLKLETTVEHNFFQEEKIKSMISFSIKNSHRNNFSYSKNMSGEQIDINKIIDINHFSIVSTSFLGNNLRGSKSSDIYNFKKYLSKSKKENVQYNEVVFLNELLTSLEKENISFDFRSNIEWNIEDFKENKNISATLLEKYNKCSFLFYLENILGIYSNPSNRLIIDIGVYIHDILENIITQESEEVYIKNEEIDLLKIEEDIERVSLNVLSSEKLFEDINIYKKKLLVLKINNYMKDLIINILEQVSQEAFKILASEEVIEMDMLGFNFIGKIDSLLKYNNNYMVVDYKSGSTDIDLSDKALEVGTNLQNIIYFILLAFKYDNVKFAGSYKYRVTPTLRNAYKDEENKSLRDGYTNIESTDIVNNINLDNYKSLKQTKAGFSKTSKTLNEEEFETKKRIVLNVIENFIIDLKEKNKYEVNPLKIKNNDSCEYCTYFNICYKNQSNYRVYK